jgi:hypothetical protein
MAEMRTDVAILTRRILPNARAPRESNEADVRPASYADLAKSSHDHSQLATTKIATIVVMGRKYSSAR